MKGVGWCIRIFLLGILVQFVLHTFVTYLLGWEGGMRSIIWLRKEVMVVAGGLFVARCVINPHSTYHAQVRAVLRRDRRWYMLLCATGMIFAGLSLIVHGQSLTALIYAFKYDLLGWVIMGISMLLSVTLTDKQTTNITMRYVRLIKVCLVWALFWWVGIIIEPNAMKLLGFDPTIFEGIVGSAPPAAYYTNFNVGLLRLGFVFERPIMYGFWLVVFWPLFFAVAIRNKTLQQTRYWRLLYTLNIVMTFSRGAWIAWFGQTIVLGVLAYRRQLKTFVLLGIVPLIAGIGMLAYHYKDDILTRYYSNDGHIEELQKGWSMFVDSPIVGQGAGTAGPASHQLDDVQSFNPENQFLQIFDEFGLAGGLPWLALFGIVVVGGRQSFVRLRRATQRKASTSTGDRYIFAVALGLAGLCVEGFFLHSLSDRMSLYPFMLIAGLLLGVYSYKK